MISMLLLACGAPAKPGANAMSAEPTVSISGEPVATADDAPPTADTSKTSIHLHRTEHVGDRWHVVIDHVEDAVISIHVTTRRNEVAHKHLVKHFHLDAEWTTTAVNDQQDEVSARIDVTKLTEDDVVLLKGKRIDLTEGSTKDDAILNIDGKPVSAKVRKALENLTAVRIDAASSNDDLLGTPEPQHVGGHWSIGGERARATLVNNNDVSATGLSGEATLVGVDHVGGGEFLRIKADLEIDGMVYPLHHPGATCDPALGKMAVTAVFPVGESRGTIETHTSFAVAPRIHVPGPRGVSAAGDVDMAVQRDVVATPL